MRYRKKPRNFENIIALNTVVSYIENMAIIQNEYGQLFFVECEEDQFEVGTSVETEQLTSITELPYSLQKKIITLLGEN